MEKTVMETNDETNREETSCCAPEAARACCAEEAKDACCGPEKNGNRGGCSCRG